MTAEEIVAALNGVVPDLALEIAPSIDQPTLIVPRERLVAACTTLRDTASLRFDCLDVTAVDWWPGEPRFQIIYHMASFEPPRRLRLKVLLPGEDAHLPTVSTLWPGANWLEREVFDLFGIIFDGHPDLRRVLMPEDWEGYPLRKDYPVQVRLPVKTFEPLQLTAQEFAKNVAGDRQARGHEADYAQANVEEQTKLTRE